MNNCVSVSFLVRTFICCLVGFYILLFPMSCGKIELSEITEENVPGENLPSNPSDTTADNTFLSISEVLQLENEDFYMISGYIVGYVKGNSMKSNSVFGLPADKPNTNLLLADQVGEVDPENCIAVKLEKDGSYQTRDELNLYDHPELIYCKLYLYGMVSNYFGKNGVIRIDSYMLDSTSVDIPSDSNSPTIDEEFQVIPDARNYDIR